MADNGFESSHKLRLNWFVRKGFVPRASPAVVNRPPPSETVALYTIAKYEAPYIEEWVT